VALSSFPVGFVGWIVSDLDLVNWTMQEARQLSPEHHMHSEIEGSPSLTNLLEVLKGERGERALRASNPSTFIASNSPSPA
jgi:hypothetical protein